MINLILSLFNNNQEREDAHMVMAEQVPDMEKDITTVIADDLEIHGTIKFKTSVMIKGLFEGEIFSDGLLVIGPTAKVKATITTKNMISHGETEGTVTASEQVILKSTATHTGDIATPSIMIEGGSVFNGRCAMERKSKEKSGRGKTSFFTHDLGYAEEKETSSVMVNEEKSADAEGNKKDDSGLF